MLTVYLVNERENPVAKRTAPPLGQYSVMHMCMKKILGPSYLRCKMPRLKKSITLHHGGTIQILEGVENFFYVNNFQTKSISQNNSQQEMVYINR